MSWIGWVFGAKGSGHTSASSTSVAVPSPAMEQLRLQRDAMAEALRLADGLISQGEVKAAQSVLRVTLTAYGHRRDR